MRERKAIRRDCSGIGKTKQSFKEQCDINRIMARAKKKGSLTHINARPGFYGDVSGVVDYRSALEMVRNMDSMFRKLPAKVRSRFDNDVGTMLEFLRDPGNREEAIKLGLVEKPVKEASVPPGEGAEKPPAPEEEKK